MNLSMNSDVFLSLRSNFDEVLKKVLQSMLEQKNNTAEINVKLKIELEKSCINVSYNDQREIVKPKFQHKVTSTLQVKNEESGCFNEAYELVWDDTTEKYILTEIKTGQTSLF